MNDVKINSADFAKQGSAASSSPPKPEKIAQESSENTSKEIAQQAKAEVDRAELIRKERANQNQEQQQEVKEAVTKLNDYVQNVQRDLQFNLDDNSGKTVITVVDRNTSEVVRQIPDDVALKLARDLQQDEPLSLFNAKV